MFSKIANLFKRSKTQNYISKSFTKEEMAVHAYEILNLLIGDIFSAIFLDRSAEAFEAQNKKMGKPNKFIVHYNRNRLRLAASALYRYTEVYKKRIRLLDIDLVEAENLNQMTCPEF